MEGGGAVCCAGSRIIRPERRLGANGEGDGSEGPRPVRELLGVRCGGRDRICARNLNESGHPCHMHMHAESHVTYQLHMSLTHGTCHMSHVTCTCTCTCHSHMAHGTCHMSHAHVTCHMHATCICHMHITCACTFTCTCHAHAISTNQAIRVSEEQFVQCDYRDSGCKGGDPGRAMKWAEENELCAEVY